MTKNNNSTNPNVPPSPALPSDLKAQNRRIVLSAFRDGQGHSAGDISAQTGISKLTVKRAIQFFCVTGILEMCGKGDSTELGGKKPELFRFNDRKYLLNITVWPDSLSMTLFSVSGEMLGMDSFDWAIPSSPEEAFDTIRESCAMLLRYNGISENELFGINFSTSGIVDYDKLILKYNVNAPGWGTNVPVGEYLKAAFPKVPCFTAENTGKAIGRAVLNAQPDRDIRTLVLFTSWGLSASLIQNGRIQNGRDSLIGEVGHMIIDPNDDELCRCGSRGCLERLVDVSRVRRRISADPPPKSSPLYDMAVDTLELHDLFDASRSGDEYARSHVRYLADCFAVMLRNVALSFNPEAVVFVGDYSAADEVFEARILSQLSMFRYLQDVPFSIRYDTRPLVELDAIGGSIMLQERYFSRQELYTD